MKKHTIEWPPLYKGKLIKRYKRFLADVKLDTGEVITAHCPNSGSMLTCGEPGKEVYLSYHDNPKRKTAYTWELIDMTSSMVGVNTIIPNRLVKQSIIDQHLPPFTGYPEVIAEPRLESGSRLDLLLSKPNGERCFIEIKNCTMVENKVAAFPDAVTTRGQKHLKELRKLSRTHARCAMFFLIQRMDADVFRPADQIDPEYGRELRKTAVSDVEIYAFDVNIDLEGISIRNAVKIEL